MPSNNASPAPENPVIPKAQENPWYIRHFIKLLIGFGLGGGAVAILLPWVLWLHCGMSSGSSDQLRLHLLYVTGGIIAVLTLLQTNWKNQGDRLKIDADIKKNEQDAEKNERDHIRQVHAERRSRYTKAVEQLADEKAAVRLGGIYTLVGLVDEWLADGTLIPEERQKEGQVIVNNLCSYIRSPFPLAEKREVLEKDQVPDDYDGNFTADQAQLREEQDIRRTIFEEMSKRSSTLAESEKGEVTVTPGAWSDFKFDFSHALIFYPLNNLTIEQGNFASARFYGEANFQNAKFTGDADFRNANFTRDANFKNANFTGDANFEGTEFTGKAHFLGAQFTRDAYFGSTEFTGDANFKNARFTGEVGFGEAKFTRNADFRHAEFTEDTHFLGTVFTGDANFRDTEFTGDANFKDAVFDRDAYFWGAVFTGDARFLGTVFTENAHFLGTVFSRNVDFRHAEFTRGAGFSEAEFTGNADFRHAEFTGNAHFLGTVFTGNAHFLGTVFTGNTDFKEAKFTGSTSFNSAYFEKYAPTFAGALGSARFSAQVNPQDYQFEAYPGSPHGFSCGEAELLNRTFILPLGTVLYDPDSWDEEKQEYTRLSEPAQ